MYIYVKKEKKKKERQKETRKHEAPEREHNFLPIN